MKHLKQVAFLSLLLPSCAAFTAAKPWVHTANDAAQALCAVYQSAKTGTAPDAAAVVQFCSAYQNYAPFIATITAKQQEARAGVPLKTAALPDQCAQPADSAKTR